MGPFRIYHQETSVIILGILFIGLTCCHSKSFTNMAYKKPNVILIVVDDLGWMDLGLMGSDYYETPNVDQLSKDGMVFGQAYASAANCAPSRACMLSGMQSPRHGIYTVSPSDRGKAKTRKLIPIANTKHLSDDVYTLPDMLKANGYTTGSFGKWHVGNDPMQQGIDVNVGGSGRGNPGKGGYFSPYKIDNIENGPDNEYLTDRLTDEAIQFVEGHKENPFFLYLPYYTVHTPIMAKPELLEKFKSKSVSAGQDNPEYAAMVYSMDQNIGRLLNKIEALKLEKNTIIVFTSDNGGIRDISDQDPLRAGKGSYYEGGIRVPMIVKWPKEIKKGTRCDTRVTNLDFFPTFESIISTSASSEHLDGEDISPLFYGRDIKERDLFWHFPIYLQAYNYKTDDGRDPLFRTRPGSVMISGDWKLHEYYEDQGFELYDLSKDLGERNNLADSEPEITRALHDKLKAWQLKMKAPIPIELNPFYDAEFESDLIKELGG